MDWDQHYQDGVTPWNKGGPAPPLQEWIENNPEELQGRILVPGCGHGHDVRELARTTKAELVLGADISDTALDLARAEGTSDIIQYENLDLFDLPYSHRGTFDWVWEHTCFCAIDPEMRDEYVTAVYDALTTGGKLLAVFYLDPYDEEHKRGEGPPHGTDIMEIIDRFVGSVRFEMTECYDPGRSYPGREGLEKMIQFTKVG